MGRMTGKEFAKYVSRDQRCYHCGKQDETLVPQHRIGRGMGSKNAKAERPSNVIVLCSYANGQIESDARFAENAKKFGWKLESWQNPSEEPIFDYVTGSWFALDDFFQRDFTFPKK